MFSWGLTMAKSKIEWTEKTWSPVFGCSPCSTGCLNCWAKAWAKRFNGGEFSVTLKPEKLEQPLHWRQPRIILVCPMSDLFHKKVPFEFLSKVFWNIQRASWHTYQILTKRIDRVLPFMKEYDHITENAVLARRFLQKTPFKNVWYGASISTQPEADRIIPILLQIPAAVRYVSIEPMLEEIKLNNCLRDGGSAYKILSRFYGDKGFDPQGKQPERQLPKLDWVIVGAESKGRGIGRDCDYDWIVSIVEQCKAANVPCYVKQIQAGGKLIKMPEEFPQEYPK